VDLSWENQAEATETPAPDPLPEARRRARWRPLAASGALHLGLLLAIIFWRPAPSEPVGNDPTMTVAMIIDEPGAVSPAEESETSRTKTGAWVAVEQHVKPEPSRQVSRRGRAQHGNAASRAEAEPATARPIVEKPPLNASAAPLNPSPKPLVWPNLTIPLSPSLAKPPPFASPAAAPQQSFQFAAAPERTSAPSSSPAEAPAAAHPPKDRQLADGQSSKGEVQARRDYAALVQRSIILARDAQGDLVGRYDGTVGVKCQIRADGSLGAITILQSSGLTKVDNAIIELFVTATDIPPPPPDVHAPVDVTFLLDLHSRR
jgi:TonB family protein